MRSSAPASNTTFAASGSAWMLNSMTGPVLPEPEHTCVLADATAREVVMGLQRSHDATCLMLTRERWRRGYGFRVMLGLTQPRVFEDLASGKQRYTLPITKLLVPHLPPCSRPLS